ncbi:MAG: 3-oxoadipate enol-lactonase [Pseudomonadota bacterium]
MQTKIIDGVVIHYRVEGPQDGPVLVFSNSLATDFRIWDPLLPHLPAGWRIVRYDKRGHGLSDCPPGPWSIEDHMRDLAGLLDTLEIKSAVVCGLSVGGMIAQALASARPDLTRAMILCDTGAVIGSEEIWNCRIAQIEAGGMDAVLDATMERWFTAPFRADAARLAPWRNMVAVARPEGYIRTSEAIRDADFRASTAALRLPCLAISGDEDKATPPEALRETAALIPDSEFALIQQAGHIPCVEQPERLGASITAFLDKL